MPDEVLKIDCKSPAGNSFAIIGSVCDILREQNIPNECVHEYIRNMLAAASYFELLDAAITITEGQISFINIPERH